jgi:hypothetical protein
VTFLRTLAWVVLAVAVEAVLFFTWLDMDLYENCGDAADPGGWVCSKPLKGVLHVGLYVWPVLALSAALYYFSRSRRSRT